MKEKQEENTLDEDLNEDEYSLLIAFKGSKYFAPYSKLIKIRMLAAESGLVSVDPFKEPTLMARYQGIRVGLAEPEAIIKAEIEKRQEAEEAETKKVESNKTKN